MLNTIGSNIPGVKLVILLEYFNITKYFEKSNVFFFFQREQDLCMCIFLKHPGLTFIQYVFYRKIV